MLRLMYNVQLSEGQADELDHILMETGAAERVTVYPLGIEFEFGAHFQGAAEDELRKLAENGAISVYIDDDADTPIILDIDGYEYIVKE